MHMRVRMASGVFLALGFADLAVLNLLLAPRLSDRGGVVAPVMAAPAAPPACTAEVAGAPPAPAVVTERCDAGAAASEAMADIVFELGQVEVPAARAAEVRAVAEEVRAGRRLLVRGHTDRIGPLGSNLALSFERARAVQRLLGGYGAPLERVGIEAVGDAEPASDSDTPRGWARNRRAQILWR